jgi:hypothetical protein
MILQLLLGQIAAHGHDEVGADPLDVVRLEGWFSAAG